MEEAFFLEGNRLSYVARAFFLQNPNGDGIRLLSAGKLPVLRSLGKTLTAMEEAFFLQGNRLSYIAPAKP
jgi:hypothetical protein